MSTLVIMLWLMANIIAIVELIRIIIESVKHGKTERLGNLAKKFFIAFAASVICVIVGASITPHSSPKPATKDTPAAEILAFRFGRSPITPHRKNGESSLIMRLYPFLLQNLRS